MIHRKIFPRRRPGWPRLSRPAVVGTVLAAAVGIAAPPAFAQPQAMDVSSQFVLSGCRALVENDPNGNAMQMGACAGAVSSVVDLGASQRHLCPPGDAGLAHAARLVIAFFDEQPGLQSQPFGPVALRALGYHWGCRR